MPTDRARNAMVFRRVPRNRAIPMHQPLLSFEALVLLHQSDPQGFEEYRHLQLQQAVARAPVAHQASLLATLERIEATRQSAKSHMEAVILAQSLMHESFSVLGEKMHALLSVCAELQTTQILDDAKQCIRTRKA